MNNLSSLKSLKIFYSRYERYLIPGALILGFLVDLITFSFINFSTALLLLLFYLVLAVICILFINIFDAKRWGTKILNFSRIFAPLLLQYSFGAILSASIIFYSFSGTIFTSWPFLLVLIFLFGANEIFKKYYSKLIFQFSILFFVSFSFFILALPFATHILGPSMFISSGILSILLIFLLIKFFKKYIPETQIKKKKVYASITSIFILVNILYFVSAIPPFPLSVRSIGAFHSLEKLDSGSYQLLSEKKSFWSFFSFYEKFSITSYDQKAFIFSSIFSPAKLNTEIVHEWQYLDPNGKWQTLSKISFPIVGGRKEGYRGYTEKDNLIPGKWRINVKTKSGQTLGRLYLKVISVESIPEFEQKVF